MNYSPPAPPVNNRRRTVRFDGVACELVPPAGSFVLPVLDLVATVNFANGASSFTIRNYGYRANSHSYLAYWMGARCWGKESFQDSCTVRPLES